MKAIFTLFLAAGFLLTGCGDSSKPGTTANTFSNNVNAPVNYLGALGAAKQHSEKTLDIVQVNQAIMYFQEAEGHNPADLNELVAKHYLGAIPKAPYGMKIEYDANTGTVKVVKQ